jgi:hypothetical protein
VPEEDEVEEIPELGRPTRWGLVVIGLSLAARLADHASGIVSQGAGMVEDVAKFWCELAMAAAGQSNHEANQREFAEQASRDIETIANGAYDASSDEARRD